MTAPDGSFAAIPEGNILFFDGYCGLCNRFVDFLIARDRAGLLRFAPVSGSTAARLLPGEIPPGEAPRSLVLWQGGRVLRRSDAALRALAGLGGPWRMTGILRVVPRGIRDALYDRVARNRYRWFGRRTTCRVPLETERARFLP